MRRRRACAKFLWRMLAEYLQDRILVADGAMGTYLYSLGVPKGHCYDELSLSNPELVERVHREYLSAGARLITTNTFGANRHILEKYYDLGARAVDINVSAVRAARRASEGVSEKVFVAGDVGPVTRPFESAEEIPDAQLAEIFSEQIAALVEGGVDLILFETFADLGELRVAISAARSVAPEVPILASMSFVDGKTLLGNDPEEVGGVLAVEGVFAAGANCGRGPREILDAAKQLCRVFPGKVSAMPNAGQPTFVDGRFVYPATPRYFAEFARRAVSYGVNIVGGCCGTTPEHIRAVAEAVGGLKPRRRKLVAISSPSRREVIRRRPRSMTSFEKKLRAGFVLTMEVDPPRGVDVGEQVRAARLFKSLGGDAVNISDLPMARMRMSALGLAAAIRVQTGIDIVLHFTARDRNLIGMQSDLLAAFAMGIDNILALRGDPPAVGDYPFATGVFDISTYGLVKLIAAFNEGHDLLGNPLDEPTSFFIGVAFNQNSPSFERELERLERKLECGAHFVQTQPVFSPKPLERLAQYLKGRGVPIVASILPLVSYNHAVFLHNEVPGISIPDDIQARFERVGSRREAVELGVSIAKEMLGVARELAQGACIMPPFGRYDLVEKILF